MATGMFILLTCLTIVNCALRVLISHPNAKVEKFSLILHLATSLTISILGLLFFVKGIKLPDGNHSTALIIATSFSFTASVTSLVFFFPKVSFFLKTVASWVIEITKKMKGTKNSEESNKTT